jgi:colanic acid biosynthesis glycosyl transferase WcaI
MLPTVVIISQVYMPDPAAVGQHVTEAAEALAKRGWRVVVYTSARGYDDPGKVYPRRESRNGVDVRRLPLSSFGKSSLATRLLAQALFMIQATVRGLFTRGLARVLVSTSPPFAGAGGSLISMLRRVPLVWWVMDLNPDQLVASGRIHPRALAVRFFNLLNRWTLRQASSVVVLDRFMRERVLAKLPVAEKVHVIPPWPHEEHLTPPSGPNAFRNQHGLADSFVVMYSGNHSDQNPLGTLLEATKRFAVNPRVRFVFVGGGTGKADVERLIASGATNGVSLPYQPVETLGESLSAADLHVVSVGDLMVGIVHPCKIYGAMAVGSPILLFGPVDCHAGDILAGHAIGWHVRHGDVDGAEQAIREAMAMADEEYRAMGVEATKIIDERFSARVLRGTFCDLVEKAGLPSSKGAANITRSHGTL